MLFHKDRFFLLLLPLSLRSGCNCYESFNFTGQENHLPRQEENRATIDTLHQQITIPRLQRSLCLACLLLDKRNVVSDGQTDDQG